VLREVFYFYEMESKPFELILRIDWADLDLFGHVNNVAFFKYIQATRVNYCDGIGLTSLNEPDKLSFMVASSQCQFKKPLLYPGNVRVLAKVDWTRNTSFQLSYQLFNDRKELVAEAADVLVVFDHYKKVKVDISGELKERMGL
jgi:acyl-CoA thioester hydrolase